MNPYNWFLQDGYQVKDIRMELMSYNEDYFDVVDVKTFKYNRTTPAINITMKFKISVKDKIELLVQSYKFLSNKYRHFPICFQVNLKKAVEANVVGLGALQNCGNFGNFSIEKDINYHACNFVVDESCLPPLIPSGRYRDDLKMLYLNEEIMYLSLFGEIYTPVALPKK